MKKTKLLILSLLTLASSSAWGQTDVTSDYLVNPSFETGNVEAITSLDGWTLPSLGGSFVNISLGSSSACSGNAFGIPTPSDGDKYYFNRRGWNSNASSEGTLSTVTKIELPEGKYTISFDYKVLDSYDKDHPSKGSTLTIKAIASDNVLGQETITFEAVNGNSAGANKFTNDAWQTLSTEFNVISSCQVTFSIVEKLLGGVRSDVVIDNVKLYFDNTVDKTNLVALIAKAEGLYSVSGVGAATFKTAIDAAKAVSTNTGATIAEVLSAETDLQAAIKTYHIANPSEEHPYDMTDEIGNIGGSITGWTSTTGAQNNVYKTSTEKNNGEYTATGFIENWNKNNFTGEIFYTLTNLYAGHYKVSAYAFDSPKSGSVYFYANDKEVALDTSTDLFTNPTLTDVLVGENGNMKLGLNVKEANTNWIGITNIKLEYIGLFTEADKILAAKADLLTAIEAKPAISANVGDGAFQYSTANADSYNKILTDAQDVYDNPSATLADVNNAKESVTNATLPTLNGPKANTRYALVLKYKGWTYDNKAVTYIANDRNDHGLYNIKYLKEVNSNYAQAFIFTPVEGDKYKLSQIDADGNERFVCTGVPYGGNTAQIRTTTDASKALEVEVRATATEGRWNLWNTEANQFIGSQDAGFFTVNSHIDFEIVEAQPAQATLNINEGVKYGTFIAPFKAEIPEGVTLYNVNKVNDEVNGTSLVLTPEEGGIAANTPYVAYSENAVSKTLSGWGTAKSESYTAGALIGTFVETTIGTTTDGVQNYVLQNHEGTVGFYQVKDSSNKTIKANRCYMSTNVDPAADVKGFVLDDIVTGISQILSNSNKAAEGIYDLNGNRLAAPQKGINIINGVKVLVK